MYMTTCMIKYMYSHYQVLDEADRLLESCFEDDLEIIFSNITSNRQTLLFSATLTDSLNRLKELSTKALHCWIAPTESVSGYSN